MININYGKESIDLPKNERDTTQKDSPLLNLTSIVKSVVSPVQDLLKTSKKKILLEMLDQQVISAHKHLKK